MKTASYTKTPQGDGFLFNVTPAPKIQGGCAGIFLKLLIASIPAIILGGIGTSQESILALILAFVVPIVLFVYLIKRDMRMKNHRSPSFFSVFPSGIEVNGQRIDKDNIHRIIIKNAYDKTPNIQLTGQTISTGAGMGHDIRNTLEQISYSLDVEAGGRATQLAGGMDDVTANGLLTDVSRILGFS